MEKKPKMNLVVLTEEPLKNIWARFSLRSIARFRSVCKEWKLLIDSDIFRDHYLSLNSSSSSVSWSIMNNKNKTEIVGHYRCKRWGITKSLGSFITHYNPETAVRKTCVLCCTDGLVLLYTETMEGAPMYHVGNPLLQQWVRIPFPPHLSGYDLVRLQGNRYFNDNGLVTKMEKGLWITKEVSCSRSLIWSRLAHSVPLNGILHWLATIDNSSLDANYVVAYDFYNGGDECPIIPFPDIQQFQGTRRFKRTLTTSAGFVVYCNVYSDSNGGERAIRVWRLVSTNENLNSWQLSWKVNTKGDVDYFPVVMHPINFDVIYLWSWNKNALVLFNLRTQKYSLHREAKKSKSMDGCILTLSNCKEYMDLIYPSFVNSMLHGSHYLFFSQYVLPRWLNPLPRLSS
ncbi:F-box domain [Arabidopsis thaliana x Arabidopsis arenosa]|uniref:F-box domain n=1 Tax=Arabidopsis thaliana x Arabidopsis arenosa TaxID=1240361 RepID=A0A8T1Z287_9BRAS|nr:F-box domain [Arabidopsis thaliana x Arabidopsis arenosa]